MNTSDGNIYEGFHFIYILRQKKLKVHTEVDGIKFPFYTENIIY